MQLKADDRPPHVIACLTQHLSAYKEYEWLETITTEMIERANLLKAFSEAMGVLRDTLALSGISEEFFEAQLPVRRMDHCSRQCSMLPKVVTGLCLSAMQPESKGHVYSINLYRIAIVSSVNHCISSDKSASVTCCQACK